MILKRSLKENKHIAAQMDLFDPLLEEVVFAFQDPRVLALVADITGLAGLEPDSNLYAGGISAMQKGAYLRPHLDNSHDRDRQRYRVLNLLFYVTPGWREEDGGNLQLWDDGPTGAPRTIPSAFNSLVIMLTNRASWHSVSEVVGEGRRCCVSNYYFSRQSPDAEDYFHATSFRGEYGRGLADKVMQADNVLRTAILGSGGGRMWRNPHVYVRPDTHES
jgi:Rps23 Pro-64 3,4-dihydroxylase Tpa1-like proline 4-hydroxylase